MVSTDGSICGRIALWKGTQANRAERVTLAFREKKGFMRYNKGIDIDKMWYFMLFINL